ncbi:hypothetical protein AVEN_263490-1 [Araneus ventricosus]|uniref:Uncharacterized protein n=1 Tax=Araneus ventricosus TaxID=182803 RepID=A0A4Y2EY92_ARAVE|nr:hypothetical protein AVEN_263490-1 [Araneus ventricosus]
MPEVFLLLTGFEESRNEDSSLNGRTERSHEVMGFQKPRRGANECSDGEGDYPYFDRNNNRNVSYQLSKTAYLHCTICQLGNQTSCKKEDLILVTKEIGENVRPTAKICNLKEIILNSDEYKGDPDFVKGVLENAVQDRKLQEEKQFELEKLNKEQALIMLRQQQVFEN